MKSILPFALVPILLLQAIALQGQSKAAFPPKIKIILLGTFHYGETTDRNKTTFADEFSAKRQGELDELTTLLAAQHPDHIFIEAVPKSQHKIDSLYQAYRQGKLTDSSWVRNEIVQLGFRTALKTTAKAAPTGIDYRQELPYPAMQQFEKTHQKDPNPPFFETPYPFTDAGLVKLNQTDLRRYYRQINSSQARERSLYDYLHYALAYSTDDDYTGADFATSWYSRNLKIMTNLFRALKPTDKCIVLIMGSGHTALLHQLLSEHPRFEIVEVDKVL